MSRSPSPSHPYRRVSCNSPGALGFQGCEWTYVGPRGPGWISSDGEIFLLLPEDPGYAEAATTQTRYNQSHGSSTERGIIRDPALRQSGRLQLQIKLLERLSETELSATDLEIYKICKEDFSEFEEANAKSQNSGKDEGSAEIDVIDRDISRAKDLIEKVEDKIAAVKKQEDGEEGWIHLRGRL